MQQLEEESGAVTAWLDAVDKYLQENSHVPLGEQEMLEQLLDTSNVSVIIIIKYDCKFSFNG